MPRRLTELRNPYVWGGMVVCYWLTLAVLTHMPISESLAPATEHDKTLHFVAFGLLAALLGIAWGAARGRLTFRQLIVLWLVCIVYGALDEWTQGFVGRHTSVFDWLADAAGAALGLALFAASRRWIQRRGGAMGGPVQ